MSEISEEEIVAFVDGRMPPAERQAFLERISVDPQLARRVEAHRWLSEKIVAAYGAPPDGESDERLIAQLGLSSENVRSISTVRSVAKVWHMLTPTAVAASLAIGLLLGRGPLAPQSLVLADADGVVVAKGKLAESLQNQLSGGTGSIRIGLSIKSKDGVCRTFEADGRISGLACKNGERWELPILEANTSRNVDGEYRVAAGGIQQSVMSAVDRRMIGEPLTLDEERRLRSSGWR